MNAKEARTLQEEHEYPVEVTRITNLIFVHCIKFCQDRFVIAKDVTKLEKQKLEELGYLVEFIGKNGLSEEYKVRW